MCRLDSHLILAHHDSTTYNYCGFQLSFSGREAHLKPLVDEIASKLDNEATKGVFEVDMDDGIKNPIILDYSKHV